MRSHTMWLSIVLFIAVFGVGCRCNGVCNPTVIVPCGEEDIDNQDDCIKKTVGKDKCCFRASASKGAKCVVDGEKVLKDALSGGTGGGPRGLFNKGNNYVLNTAGVPKKPTNEDIQKAAKSVPGTDSEEVKRQLGNNVEAGFNNKAQQRSLTFVFAALGGGGSFLNSALFPKCPVHVKYCYRVPCGGTYNAFKESNAKSCLSDPTCCYDYSLAFLKSILGPGFMRGTPVCHYGATSNQWKFITGFFRPWNAWYTNFILDAFASVFDTSAFNSAGKFACSITGLRKAYPVGSKSKLECSLVSGCWDDSLPEGSKCTMASSFAQNIFTSIIPGLKKEVYPSLYTNDPSDTTCSSNWFDYGPKAYRRMPCGIGPAPTNLIEKLSWCPLNDCCLNYASLNPQDIGLLQAFGGAGVSSGSPFGPSFGSPFDPTFPGAGVPGLGGLGLGGITSNTLLAYLIQSGGGSSLSLSELFCPYKNFFTGSSSSLFPDLSEYTDGCCTIPECYHKKKLREGGYIGWGQWSDCSSLCGQGTRTRQCYANNKRVSALTCGGSSSEPCTGTTCTTIPPPPPSMPEWTEWSACSVTCGNGVRSRMCYYNGQQVSPNSCGFGAATDPCYNGPCATAPPPPPVFASWGQWSSCSVTCGDGTRTRACLYNNQVVEDFRCGPGSTTEQCYQGICPTIPPPPPVSNGVWGRWQPTGGCSATCGGGTQQWTRPCLVNNVQTDPSRCPGGVRSGSAQANCGTPPCPTLNGVWSPWVDATDCGATCGRQRLKRQTRTCTSVSGSPLPETACVGESMQVVPCPDVDCSQQYYWTGYTTSSSCNYDSATGRCSRKQTRYCYQKDPFGWSLVQPQSQCGKQTEMDQDCDFQECFSG